MTEKEKQIQDALGLLKTYTGYVKGQGITHFDVYEVQDVTMDGAREQLTKIICAGTGEIESASYIRLCSRREGRNV